MPKIRNQHIIVIQLVADDSPLGLPAPINLDLIKGGPRALPLTSTDIPDREALPFALKKRLKSLIASILQEHRIFKPKCRYDGVVDSASMCDDCS